MTRTRTTQRVQRRLDRVGGRTERGSTSIQLVVLLPALFTIMFLGMQGALWYHARSVAIAAAQQGARTAGEQNTSADAGISDAASFVADAGGSGVLANPTITAARTATTATVTVSGSAMSVIPGWTLTVRQSATTPVERLTR